MNRSEAIAEIRSHWKDLYPADKHGGIICPLCGSGSGKHGSGITGNKNHGKPDSLRCWSCDFQGDVIDLIQKDQRLDFNGALEYAANELGITIDRTEAQNSVFTDFKPIDEELYHNSVKPLQNELQAAEEAIDYSSYYAECQKRLNDPQAAEYLHSRGISIDTAAAAGFGYDPQADPACNPGGTGRSYHPVPRIIMPTSKAHYVGRRIDGIKDYAKVNPKDSHPGIFNLNGLYNADRVFITEGAFDAVSIMEAGEVAIATCSTANTDLLLKHLQEKPTEAKIAICFDNDNAGRRATETLDAGLNALGIEHIQADICGKFNDPNEALQNDPEGFKKRVRAAADKAAAGYVGQFLETIQSEAYKPYKTDLTFFDNLLDGGVIRQTLLLLLAAPATGKTTLCQQIAESMARHGKPVIYLNLEMSWQQMIAKTISSRLARKKITMSTLDVLQGYRWTDEQRAAVTNELQEYNETIEPFLHYNPRGIGSDLDRIKSYLQEIGEQAKAEGREAPVVVLDYLHLISSSKPGIDNQELIKQTVEALKQYAIRFNTFVIAISAVRRLGGQSQITLDSGRDSSNIEYTADYQLSLNYYAIDKGEVKSTNEEAVGELKKQKYRKMLIRVLKSRFCTNGQACTVYFNPVENTFYSEDEYRAFSDFEEVDDAPPFNDDEFANMKVTGKR